MLSDKAKNVSPSPTLAISAKAKEMKSQGIDVIGFGAGEPDFDTPEHIKKRAIKEIENGFTGYTPAAGVPELKEVIANKLKSDNNLDYGADQIVVSNGAKHSILNACSALLNEGDEALVLTPYWVSYPELVKLGGGSPKIIETSEANNFKVTIKELENSMSSKTKLLILNSPSNPSGQMYTEEELKEIGDFVVKNDIYVISDEIYEYIVYDDNKHVSVASLGSELKDRTIIINGVSKSYAMTGWRIGYTASNLELAKAMGAMQSHATSNPCSISQMAAHEAINGPQDCVGEMVKEFDKRREFMQQRISEIPYLEAMEPQGAFYMFVSIKETSGMKHENNEIKDSQDFAKYLLESKKVALVPGDGFGAKYYVRISYATSMDNIERGLDRIEEFLKELS